MTKTASFSKTIKDVIFFISYDYEPHVPGRTHTKLGDPGDPPEGGSIEECRVFIEHGNGERLDITDALDVIGGIDYFYDRAYEDMETL